LNEEHITVLISINISSNAFLHLTYLLPALT